MQVQPVESSVIRAVGYDAGSRTLQVEFSSGAVYQYFDVPPEEHAALLRAESLGRYFREHVRDSYRYVRVRG